MLPSDVIGVSVYNPATQEFEFKPGPIFANIIVADEINRTTPKTQSALLEAMNEAQITVDNHTHPLPQPFHRARHAESHRAPRHVSAARIAARPLPDAHSHGLSRRAKAKKKSFAIIPAPDHADKIAAADGRRRRRRDAGAVSHVKVDDSLLDYALEIVERTRQTEQLSLGVSPRGTVMLHRAAQARAFLEGRDYCLPDDFKQLSFRSSRTAWWSARATSPRRKNPSRPKRSSAKSSTPRAFLYSRASYQRQCATANLRLSSAIRSFAAQVARDRPPGWRNFGIAMLALSPPSSLALFSAAVAQEGRIWLAGDHHRVSLGIAGWVAITIVPALARRTSLRWIAYQIDYRLTRDGIIYLAARFLFWFSPRSTPATICSFMILACLLAGILDFRSALARRAHGNRTEIRSARAHFRRAARAGRTRAAQRKADVAVLFAARDWRDKRKRRPKFSRGPFSFPTSRE